MVVTNIRISMNESKSQPTIANGTGTAVVTNIRISMNESKSQLEEHGVFYASCCYKYQNINERKQITTTIYRRRRNTCCYKYQNINERKQITTQLKELSEIHKLLQISEYQ